MDEQQLEKLARGLGARAAEQLDVERTAQAVVRRLKDEPVPVVWWRRTPGLQSLAAAAIAVSHLGLVGAEVTTMCFYTLALAQLWHVFNMRASGPPTPPTP